MLLVRALPSRREHLYQPHRERLPGWLNILVLLFIWNAMKFLVMGPVSLVLLIRAHVQQTVARRHPRVAESDSRAGVEV